MRKINLFTREVVEDLTVDNASLDDIKDALWRLQEVLVIIEKHNGTKRLKRPMIYGAYVEAMRLREAVTKLERRIIGLWKEWPKEP